MAGPVLLKAFMSILSVLGAALLVLALWLGQAQWRAAVARRAARTAYFDRVAVLFDRVELRVQPSGFVRMTGVRGADAFDLQAVPDSLTFRKLPALWVMVTLPQALPVAATLDVMARPTGTETFSHFAGLKQGIERPDFLPDGTALRSDNAAAVDPGALRTQAGVFDDPRVKELVISPKGLRIVILAEEADRGRYLLFRDAEMGHDALDPSRVSGLLETLLALRDQIGANVET